MTSKLRIKIAKYVNIAAGIGSVIVAGGILVFAATVLAGSGGHLTERNVTNEMHKIANNYIIADEIWGTQEMTHEGIDQLLHKLNSIKEPSPNVPTLIDILTRWKQGDFSKLDLDHNYVWRLLGGDVGYATGVRRTEHLPAWALDS